MKSGRLAVKLLIGQILVLFIGALTLIVTSFTVAPELFANHLSRTKENSPVIRQHTNEAFASSLTLSLALASLASLVAAGLVSWLLVRRISRPIEQLADAVDAVASHRLPNNLPIGGFSIELRRLNAAFANMSADLSKSEQRRTNMLADLAHELRTPLATLNAYVDGLEDGVVPVSQKSWITLRQQLSRMERLINDLKEASAADENAFTMDFAYFDVREIARSAVAVFQPRCELDHKELRIVAPANPLLVKADSQRLQQVLVNLLDNACRHTPSGGEIEVRLARVGNDAVIEVSDSGPGIPSDQLEAVFQRFYRVDSSRKQDGGGSGLGLTIARAIVERHGGSLEAMSPGRLKGATFKIKIATTGG